jgi:fluoroacetyl-CoA thioesterase
MSAAPSVGLRHSATLRVTPEITVPALPPALGDLSDMPTVFATAYMVAFIEATCIEALKPHLSPGQHSVGTHIDVSHLAATPVGMTVTSEVELVAVEGRKLRFKITCRDDKDLIGEGFHERFVIDVAKFNARLAAKGQ